MNHFFFTLVYLTLPVTGLGDDLLYCAARYRRLCQGKGRHVGCQFNEPGPGASCENYNPVQFHSGLKQFITHYLNRRRQRIASGNERVRGGMHLPKPEVMMMVEWDRELASLAQRLADQCSFVHDDCRATVRYPYAGQTVGEVRMRRSSDSDALTAQRAIRRVFDAWWGERRRVRVQQLTAPFRITAKGAVWGHFSQLAVWSLRAVGCGAVRHGTSCPRMLLVCDFSHTNMLGQRTLTPGALVPCPVHTARRARSQYPLLCAPVRQRFRTDDDSDGEETVEQADDDYHTVTTASIPVRNITRAMVTTEFTTKARRTYRLKVRVSTKMTRMPSPGEDDTHRPPAVFLRKLTEISTKRTTKELIAEKVEPDRGSARLKAQHKFDSHHWVSRGEQRTVTHYQVKMIETTLGEETLNTTVHEFEPSYLVRHKWQQTRNRPMRPGASALLNLANTGYTRRSPAVAMMFDKEDVDQLFKDTGFNPSWMRKRLPKW